MSKLFVKVLSSIKKLQEKNREDSLPVNKGFTTKSLAEEGKDLLYNLASNLGPRGAGTKESRKASRKIASEFEIYSSDVNITSAKIYSSLGTGMLISSSVITVLMAFFTIFNMPLISLILGSFFAWCLYSENKGGKNFFKCFIPSSEAANVSAVIEPERDVKKTIIFSAHHDSARIKPEGKKAKLVFFFKTILPIIAFLLILFLSFIELVIGAFKLNLKPSVSSLSYIILSTLAMLLSILAVVSFFLIKPIYSPGAGDNLSGVVTLIEVLKYFSNKKKEGKGLKETKLIFVSFDGEECGLQGSRVWYQENKETLVNAINFNIDGLYEKDDLTLITSEGNGSQQLSTALANFLAEEGKKMGYKINVGKLGLLDGETDAASARKVGLEATTLTSMRPEAKTPAHTLQDTPSSVSESALNVAIALSIKLAEEKDKEGKEKEEKIKYFESEKKYKLTRS